MARPALDPHAPWSPAPEAKARRDQPRHDRRLSDLARALLKRADAHDTAGQMSRLVVEAERLERHLAEQQRRIRELEARAITDPLTGIMNRRGLLDALARVTAAARRQGQGGIVMYLDLDDFKSVNDTLGHEAGDAVLATVARLLEHRIRESDIVARLGGDEFAVVLTHADEVGGKVRAEMLEREINSASAFYRGRSIPIAASVGIIAFDGLEDAKTLLRQADKAMYARKRRSAGNAASQATTGASRVMRLPLSHEGGVPRVSATFLPAAEG